MRELLKNISPLNNRREMPTALFVVKKILAFWLCYIAGLLLAEAAVVLLHFAFGKNMLVGDVFDSQTITLITYYGYGIVLGVGLVYWKWIEKKPFSEMGLTRGVWSYLIGALAGVFLLAVTVAIIIFMGGIEYCGAVQNADIPVIFLLFGGFVVQGATEELLCRGIALHSLKEKAAPWVAISISNILFVIPHLSSLLGGGALYGMLGVANLLLISTIFSLLTLGFQSIWAACGLHSFWNALLYSVLGLNLSGNDGAATALLEMRSVGKSIWNGGEYGIEASAATTVVLAVAVALIWYIGRKCHQKAA